MDIKKTIITVAGRDQRTLPLQTLVDRDGVQKAALRILIEEALAAGIEEVCLVVHPGDQAAFRTAAGPHAGRLQFVEQGRPLGYGHAVACAAAFAGRDAFLLMVGDHLYVSGEARGCAQQLVELARAEHCAVSAVQATHESKLPFYGAIGGRLEGNRAGLYLVENVVEKPTPTQAEQSLVVPGLRAGHYLCFFGMHVLTPALMNSLAAEVGSAGVGSPSISLSPALATLASRERYLACELRGRRYDIGAKYGLLTAQLAIALAGGDRDEVLADLVEFLAQQCRRTNGALLP